MLRKLAVVVSLVVAAVPGAVKRADASVPIVPLPDLGDARPDILGADSRGLRAVVRAAGTTARGASTAVSAR